VRRPFDEALVHEAPRSVLRIDLYQHVSIGVVACGGHDVVLRTVVAMVVHPLVLVTRDHKLDGVLIFAQKRVQPVVGKLSWLVLDQRVVDEDEGRLVLLKLSLKPVKLLFPERANVRMEIRRV